MRIALDVLAARGYTGLAVYTRGVACALASLFPSVDWTFIGDAVSLCSIKAGFERVNGTIAPRYMAIGGGRFGLNRSLPSVADLQVWRTMVGKYLEEDQYDLLYSPTFYLPTKDCSVKMVTTILDVTFHTIPSDYSEDWRIFFEEATKDSCLRSSAIICPSVVTQTELFRNFLVPQDRVHVIPPGIGREFSPASQREILRVREKYSLSFPYVLDVVGSWKPRKNTRNLLSAYEILHRISGTNAPVLILVSQVLFHSPQLLGSVPDGVRLLPYIPQSDLSGVISGAHAVVYPSQAEGFGMPVLEALACGTAAVVSDLPIFHETTSGHAIYVDEEDPESIAYGIISALDQRDRVEMREERICYARLFDWSRTAMSTMRVFEDIVTD